MNTNISPQDILQAQFAAAQPASAPDGNNVAGAQMQSDGDPSGEWQPSSQMMLAAHQAAAANDVDAFNSLLRSAAKARDVHARANAKSSGNPNNPSATAGAPAASPVQQQQRLAAALAAMQQGAGAMPGNFQPGMSGGGMNVPNSGMRPVDPRLAPLQRTPPPFMPQRLDRFESFLGNFIGALGEGMSIQQAAQSTLRNLRAQQMLQNALAARAMQAQAEAQAQQAAQGGMRNPAQPALSQAAQRFVPGQTAPGGARGGSRQQNVSRQQQQRKIARHLEKHHAIQHALIDLIAEKYEHGKRNQR